MNNYLLRDNYMPPNEIGDIVSAPNDLKTPLTRTSSTQTWHNY